ncbi:hypothetical protein PFICI_07445 [Pestalotiopsis fici W106-1]|uniref:Gfo/Idh/MocA-like oxidoreductase N-terminal domain-containing protein n=1 Tax=Pestalotiopsis fici (strain W106-1 / CGMCC3.15140) TaxID=1229662 RepID=W3X418_PESFW|nr:uncharacterized protein PFICI_07445 [Pestalotiopsis fici W106-1]ETS79916.1 hypothetical protein PFICI_07445 [Pestalotiopsis fici W106-1]
MTKTQIAIIGAGLIGPRHAEAVAKSAGAQVAAIVDVTPKGSEIAAKFGVPFYSTVADMLQSSAKPDAAIICTPNHTHVSITKELLAANVHVLVEKPVSTDIASGKELVQLAGTVPAKTLVGHHRRFNPYMVAAKEVVSSGSLGRVIGINGIWALHKPSDYFEAPTDWRQGSTGGVVLINMVHEVDLLHYLLGPITSVHAEKTISQRGYAAEEGAAITLRFKSGAVGSFFICDNTPSPWNFEAGTGENPLIPKTGENFYRVFGTEASLSVPDMTIWSYKGTQKSWHSEIVREQSSVPDGVPFELQVDHFVRVIRGEEAPSCTAQAGLAALVVCQAIKDALEDNSTVQIEKYEL